MSVNNNPKAEEKQVLRTFGGNYLLVAPGDRIDEFDLFGWASKRHGGVIFYDQLPECLGQSGPAAFNFPTIR